MNTDRHKDPNSLEGFSTNNNSVGHQSSFTRHHFIPGVHLVCDDQSEFNFKCDLKAVVFLDDQSSVVPNELTSAIKYLKNKQTSPFKIVKHNHGAFKQRFLSSTTFFFFLSAI